MNKLGIFVEGYTEVIFVEKLIEEVAGENRVTIEHREIRGGRNVRRTFARVKAVKVATEQKYFVLIVDCGGDSQVKSRILEEHENFTKQGYSKIIGLRDVFPDFSRADLPRLERELSRFIRTSLIPVEFILGVMEIEAWFLAEVSHFPRIAPAITVPAIKASLGFDPELDDMQLRNNPSSDLNDCYGIGGKEYRKAAAEDTVNALDFSEVYVHTIAKFLHLERLADSINAFLA